MKGSAPPNNMVVYIVFSTFKLDAELIFLDIKKVHKNAYEFADPCTLIPARLLSVNRIPNK
jgi:hypothetical protein